MTPRSPATRGAGRARKRRTASKTTWKFRI
jgi:hypothetical protein